MSDPHPHHGGRFLFERVATTPLQYRVAVLLPQARRLECTLSWDADAHVRLEPDLDDAWARGEVVKLARVVHRERPTRVSRWRGPAGDAAEPDDAG
ncbi:MAG: hypothetical protein K1X88_09405 [Nannocystaceae bacterium]|nr:hypothetical protein [Nannocystaceae bacterium]